jgi:hypothetical protein
MKQTALITVTVLAFFAALLSALPAEAGSRGMRGGFYISTPGLAISTGWPGGVFVGGGGPGYSYGGGYGPRYGYPGYRPHRYGPRRGYPGYRRHRVGPGYYPDPFTPYYRHDPRWGSPSYDRRRYAPPRRWTSRTWVPGRMTSQGFAPGYWSESPLTP